MDKIDKINSQLDEIGSFFKLGRMKLVNSIRDTINDFHNDVELLQDSLESTTLKLKIEKDKYNLVSSFLNAKPLPNDNLEVFKNFIANDFIEFANQESSLAEEAKALVMLQDIEKRLEQITTFPSIYNKNIVAVGGGFSAGKSEFLNSFFIDKQIKLPVGINPVTAIPTYITVGDANTIKGYSYKGGIVKLSSEMYKKLSHDFIKSLGFNLKDIAPIMAIETPMESYSNICFIDTPGYNPSNTGYTDGDSDTSREYLNHANTLLWVVGIDTNGTIPKSDLEFLESIALEDKKIYLLANKADLRSFDDIEDILDVFEEILDEYDIEYEGISAFSSINKKELMYKNKSLFDFLEEVNNPVNVQISILSELNTVFDMYKDAINGQIEWIKNIQLHFNSLELDLLESGIDVEDSGQIDERLEKMKNLFNTSNLKKQLKQLEELRENMTHSVKEVFLSLE